MAEPQEPGTPQDREPGSTFDPANETLGPQSEPAAGGPAARADGTTILRRNAGARLDGLAPPSAQDTTDGTQEVLLFHKEGQEETGARPASRRGSVARPAKPAPAAGKAFGSYVIVEEVSRGSFGVVYKAKQRGLDRVVALKVLLAGSHASPEAVARFHREARAAARLKHPSIVPIYEIGEADEHHFFAMEFVEGAPLSKHIAGRQVSIGRALELAEILADAVRVAHESGVIHRDIKPSNIIVDPSGYPRITDFGLAKQVDLDTQYTQSGTTLGTPAYMPPEQARGEVDKIDARSDVYALGAVLYEMLTGQAPYAGRSLLEVVVAVINEPVRPPRQLNPKIHRDIQTIVMKCLEKDPGNRYASSEELRDDIRRFRSGEAIKARPVGMLRGGLRVMKRNSWFLTAVATVLVAVGFSAVEIRRMRDKEEKTSQQVAKLEEKLKAKPPSWNRVWWYPIQPGDELWTEDAEAYKAGFVHPQTEFQERTEGANPRRILPPQNLVSPYTKLIIGDFKARIRFRLDPEGMGHALRFGILSHDSAIPYLFEIQPGRLAIVAPLGLHYAANRPGMPAPLEVKAEKSGPELVAGEYELQMLRDGLELRFQLSWPGGQVQEQLCIWDVGLSHWKFKNVALTIRDLPEPERFRVLEAEVARKVWTDKLDAFTHTIEKFQKGDYNEAESDLKMVLEEVKDQGEPDAQAAVKAGYALYYMGLIQEIWHPSGEVSDAYYAQALDRLNKSPVSDELNRLEAQLHLRRLIRAGEAEKWGEARSSLERLRRIEGRLAQFRIGEHGLGEPYGWELQPLLGHVLQRKDETGSLDLALNLFKLMGLPPGSRRLGARAGELGALLVERQSYDQLIALHQAYPAGELRQPFVAVATRYCMQGLCQDAYKTLKYAVQNFKAPPDKLALEQAGSELLGVALDNSDFEIAKATLELLPRPALAARLGKLMESAAAQLAQKESKPLLDLVRLAKGAVAEAPGESKALAAGCRAYGSALVDAGQLFSVRALHEQWPDPGLAPIFARALQTLAASDDADAFEKAVTLLGYCRNKVDPANKELARAAFTLASRKAVTAADERYLQILRVQQAYPGAGLGGSPATWPWTCCGKANSGRRSFSSAKPGGSSPRNAGSSSRWRCRPWKRWTARDASAL
ncbi:MAG: serine/threonine protein kinase [Planctomycetota bacterium]|nr:serine/threonine protein kinase [Planctomycetota bacterium]